MSFSRLTDFEKCKYLVKLKYIDKHPEPPRSLPVGKTEHANDRGTRVHDAAEAYVRGGVELVPELKLFEDDFKELRRLFALKKVSLEGEWAVDEQWNPVAWGSEDAWFRAKLDAIVMETPEEGRVIDYKTGKRFGNEVKHTEQGQIYQLASFMRFPELQSITVEFWYTDLGEKDVKTYSREQGIRYFEKYNKRLLAMSDCVDFKPNPNAFSCKWCPYKGNICVYGIDGAPKQGARVMLRDARKGYTVR